MDNLNQSVGGYVERGESIRREDLIFRPRNWLLEEFNRKRSKNQKFSLRAFARQLEISSGRLSEFLSGKRHITAQMANRLVKKLGLDSDSAEQFIQAVVESKKARRLLRK